MCVCTSTVHNVPSPTGKDDSKDVGPRIPTATNERDRSILVASSQLRLPIICVRNVRIHDVLSLKGVHKLTF